MIIHQETFLTYPHLKGLGLTNRVLFSSKYEKNASKRLEPILVYPSSPTRNL